MRAVGRVEIECGPTHSAVPYSKAHRDVLARAHCALYV
jgi:hypothetical protein